jgi:hypothetical protein
MFPEKAIGSVHKSITQGFLSLIIVICSRELYGYSILSHGILKVFALKGQELIK